MSGALVTNDDLTPWRCSTEKSYGDFGILRSQKIRPFATSLLGVFSGRRKRLLLLEALCEVDKVFQNHGLVVIRLQTVVVRDGDAVNRVTRRVVQQGMRRPLFDVQVATVEQVALLGERCGFAFPDHLVVPFGPEAMPLRAVVAAPERRSC